ncbi:MAG: hypothetical protein JXA94_05760, partial [Parachlamydiales bacterium]|nr:hypothetical protein [Parachlamydiales bacterium]
MNKNYNSAKQKLFIYGLYSKIISNEKHYTVLQSKYKTNATYWLLIIFAAIGVVFSSEEISLPLDSMIATTIICLVGIIGILFFWYEDIMIQERFLNINFLEGTLMEKKYTWLPQVHHQHLVYTHKTMLKLKNLFFVGCIVILYI